MVAIIIVARRSNDDEESPTKENTISRSSGAANQTTTKRSHNNSFQNTNRVAPSGEIRELADITKADSSGPEALTSFILKLLNEDEQKGLEFLADLKTNIDYETIGAAVYDHYIQEGRYLDGLAAFETLNKNLTLTTPLLHSFVSEYYRNEPQKALSWVAEHTHINGIEMAAYTLGEHSSKADEAGSEITSMLNSDLNIELRASYLDGAMTSLMEKDLDAAFTFFADAELPGFYYDETVYKMTGKAAETDPTYAMAWADSIIDEQLRHSAISEIAESWTSASPEEFEEWIAQQRPKLQAEIKAVRSSLE